MSGLLLPPLFPHPTPPRPPRPPALGAPLRPAAPAAAPPEGYPVLL